MILMQLCILFFQIPYDIHATVYNIFCRDHTNAAMYNIFAKTINYYIHATSYNIFAEPI